MKGILASLFVLAIASTAAANDSANTEETQVDFVDLLEQSDAAAPVNCSAGAHRAGGGVHGCTGVGSAVSRGAACAQAIAMCNRCVSSSPHSGWSSCRCHSPC